LGRVELEQPLDSCDDLGELGVIECPDEDRAGVRAACLGPVAQQRLEVPPIPRHEDAALDRSQLEHLVVRQALRGRLFAEGAHVASRSAKRLCDVSRGQVMIE